jgi:hypothetical protein
MLVPGSLWVLESLPGPVKRYVHAFLAEVLCKLIVHTKDDEGKKSASKKWAVRAADGDGLLPIDVSPAGAKHPSAYPNCTKGTPSAPRRSCQEKCPLMY